MFGCSDRRYTGTLILGWPKNKLREYTHSSRTRTKVNTDRLLRKMSVNVRGVHAPHILLTLISSRLCTGRNVPEKTGSDFIAAGAYYELRKWHTRFVSRLHRRDWVSATVRSLPCGSNKKMNKETKDTCSLFLIGFGLGFIIFRQRILYEDKLVIIY